MIEIKRIADSDTRRQAAAFVNEHHSYIDWADRPSRKLYWTIYESGRLIGVWGLGSAFSKPKVIAKIMRTAPLAFNELANNIVYCLNGHTDRNAGSRALSLLRRDAVSWWRERYGDKLRCFQTFVEPPRNGAVYRADNWTLIGQTVGAGQATITIPCAAYDANPEAFPGARVVMLGGVRRVSMRQKKDVSVKLIFMRAA